MLVGSRLLPHRTFLFRVATHTRPRCAGTGRAGRRQRSRLPLRAEVGAQHSLVLPQIVQRPFLWAAQWAARGCWPKFIFSWIFGIHFKTVAFWKIWFHSKCVCGFPGLPHTGEGSRLAQDKDDFWYLARPQSIRILNKAFVPQNTNNPLTGRPAQKMTK